MIKGFEHPHFAEPVEKSHWQGMPALAAGFFTGLILLIVPHASPWEGLTSFTPTILGRTVPPTWGIPVLGIVAMHLALSVIYGLIISLVVMSIRQLWAVGIGGLVGLALFGVTLAIVSSCIPEMRGNEVAVAVTHFVFGLIAAGLYRGLLRRKVAMDQSPPIP